MMNRRQFVGTAAASAVLAGMPGAHAAPAPYDVLISGGRVIDPIARHQRDPGYCHRRGAHRRR